MARKVWPELKKKVFNIVPYAVKNCRVCQLDNKAHYHIIGMRSDGKPFGAIIKYIRENHIVKITPKEISHHFQHHVKNPRKELELASGNIPAMPVSVRGKPDAKNQKLETAYNKLVRMAVNYTNRVTSLFEKYSASKTDEEILQELAGVNAAKVFAMMAELNKLAREQVKDINALRAPKAVVMQVLEQTIDATIRETSLIMQQLFIEFQQSMTQLCKEQKITLSDKIFSTVFFTAANSHKDKMMLLRNQQLVKAQEVLQDLEKVI